MSFIHFLRPNRTRACTPTIVPRTPVCSNKATPPRCSSGCPRLPCPLGQGPTAAGGPRPGDCTGTTVNFVRQAVNFLFSLCLLRLLPHLPVYRIHTCQMCPSCSSSSSTVTAVHVCNRSSVSYNAVGGGGVAHNVQLMALHLCDDTSMHLCCGEVHASPGQSPEGFALMCCCLCCACCVLRCNRHKQTWIR